MRTTFSKTGDGFVVEQEDVCIIVDGLSTGNGYIHVLEHNLDVSELLTFRECLNEAAYLLNCPLYCACGQRVKAPGDWVCEDCVS